MLNAGNENTMVFDFTTQDGVKERLRFENPEKVLIANTIDEVARVMEEVEQYTHHGWYVAGFISYEAAPAFDARMVVHPDHRMPLVWFGIYPAPIRMERSDPGSFECSPLQWNNPISEDEYNRVFNKIKNYISNGDTYQVNYTMRLIASYAIDDENFYEQLLEAQNASYSAYLNLGRFRILSVSPELFFEKNGGLITTRPMKGTIKRGLSFEEDEANRLNLMNSEKDQAENLMIVDLLRNDLSKIAKTGSVQVPSLFAIEAYPTVYQMTSTVTAELRNDVTIMDIFSALFPCGSITGAPKIRTMEIITELERTPREVYCGSIGYIGPDHQAIFNVAIRTVVVDKQTDSVHYGVGGGITWNSNPTCEFEEALLKAKVLGEMMPSFELFETIKYEDGKFELLDLHLERLHKSAHYFGFHYCEEEVRRSLAGFALQSGNANLKVNLFLNKQEQIRVIGTKFDFSHPVEPKQAVLASEPISKNNKFLYHKTTQRGIYEKHQQTKGDFFDVLLWNEERELTEFTIGNLVVKWNGEYFTPPVRCGLLPGTFRARLLRDGTINERILPVDCLKEVEQIWLINSLRGWVPIHLVAR